MVMNIMAEHRGLEILSITSKDLKTDGADCWQ